MNWTLVSSIFVTYTCSAVLLIDSLSASILQEMARSRVAYTKCHPLLSYQPRYFYDTASEQSLPRRQFKETKMAMNGLLQMLKSWMQCSCKKAIVMETLTNNTSFMMVYLSDLVLCLVIFVLFCLFEGFSRAKMTNISYQVPASATRYFPFYPTSNASTERAWFGLALQAQCMMGSLGESYKQ